MRIQFGNRDSGFGRTMRAAVRPLSASELSDSLLASRWVHTQNGIYVRRSVSRRDFGRILVASAAAIPLFSAGCGPDAADEWAWALDVLQEVVKLVEAAIGKYEARNTGENDTEIGVTTSALTNAEKKEVDRIVQVATIPSDGNVHQILTPDAQNGGLMVPDVGTYLLQGSVPVVKAPFYSRRTFDAVA